jgi:hypothetical protein
MTSSRPLSCGVCRPDHLIWAFDLVGSLPSSGRPIIIARSPTVPEPTLAHYRIIFETQTAASRSIPDRTSVSQRSAWCYPGCNGFRPGGGNLRAVGLVTAWLPAAVLISFYLMFRVLGLILTTGLVVYVALNLSFAIWILEPSSRKFRRLGGIRHGGRRPRLGVLRLSCCRWPARRGDRRSSAEGSPERVPALVWRHAPRRAFAAGDLPRPMPSNGDRYSPRGR